MNVRDDFTSNPADRLLLDEYRHLDSDEARLEWIMERKPLHGNLPPEALTPFRRVPGCLSGLWLHATLKQGRFQFASHSDSAMVQGITSFLCDLHSNHSPEEIVRLNQQLAKYLGLERLLSMNRKRAVSSVMNFIVSEARTQLDTIISSSTSEAV